MNHFEIKTWQTAIGVIARRWNNIFKTRNWQNLY